MGKVLILRKNNHLFVCKKYTILVYEYKSKLRQSMNISCIRVTAYRNFANFWEEIEFSSNNQYDSACDIIALARKYNMNIEAGYSWPTDTMVNVPKHRSTEIC